MLLMVKSPVATDAVATSVPMSVANCEGEVAVIGQRQILGSLQAVAHRCGNALGAERQHQRIQQRLVHNCIGIAGDRNRIGYASSGL